MKRLAGGLLLLLAGVLLATQPVEALSLKHRKKIKEKNEEAAKKAAAMNKACGKKIAYTIQWDSFVNAKIDEQRHGFYTAELFCGYGVNVVETLCGDEMARPEVGKKVKKIVCKFDKDATREKLKRYGPSFSLKAGTLTIGINWGTGNIAKETKKFLMNNL